jgi:hypothetical protein
MLGVLTIFLGSLAEHLGILPVLVLLGLLGRPWCGEVILVVVHDALLLLLGLRLIARTGLLV